MIIMQTTEERNRETEELFLKIKPYLDKGYNYRKSLVKVGRISSKTNLNRYRGWFKELTEYGDSIGYTYGDHIYRQERMIGVESPCKGWDRI